MTHASRLPLIAIALLVPLAAAPVSADDPGACADPCVINASNSHYDPPLVVIGNGASVVWHSTDNGHIQRETSTPAGSPGACFVVTSPGDADSPTVRFEIDGGAVKATVGSTTSTCQNAVAVAGTGFLVPYHCTLHGNMRGAIVVQA
jgi:plastocyanin